MTQIWESENDNTLIKLAKKYHKDWKKITQAFIENYNLYFKTDFLKARYTQLVKQEDAVNSVRKNLQSYEDFENVELGLNGFEGSKRIKHEIDFKEESNYFDSGVFDNFTAGDSDHCEIFQTKDTDGESFKLFFTKNEQLESKTLELPWITLDLNRELDQDNELFERVTSCHN